jgi:hypothetical protein
MPKKWSDEATFGGCAIVAVGAILGGILGCCFDLLIAVLWAWHTGDQKDSIIAWPLFYLCVPVGGILGVVATCYFMNRYYRRRGAKARIPIVRGR